MSPRVTATAAVGKLWCMAADETVPTTLIVPGDERQSLARAKDRGAGAIVFDLALPDGIAAARGQVADTLATSGWGAVRRLVRVNAWTSPHTYRDVVEIVEVAGEDVDALVLPGVRSVHEAAALDLLVGQIEATMGLPVGGIGVVVQFDDARGVQAAADVAVLDRVSALACNACDFTAPLLLAARAAGVPAYCLAADGAHVERARLEGFDGAWVDDPTLVGAAADAFAD